jgi:hypothetical protein
VIERDKHAIHFTLLCILVHCIRDLDGVGWGSALQTKFLEVHL